MMQKHDAILVTGSTGLVGANLVHYLRSKGFAHVIPLKHRDLTNRAETREAFEEHRPDYVFHMAGYVRGIAGNMANQAEAYLQNTLMAANVIDACRKVGVKKIVAMGTVAMYPCLDGPLREDMLFLGEPHHSERGYAHAKRGMLAQLEAYKDSYGLSYALPVSTNLYGPHDRFNAETGHCIPSLIRKFHDARMVGEKVTVWGDGSAKRDFLYVKDAVEHLHTIMDEIEGPINLATGKSERIGEVVGILAEHTGMSNRIVWDDSKPVGQTYRSYSTRFSPRHSLRQGLIETFDWYAANQAWARK